MTIKKRLHMKRLQKTNFKNIASFAKYIFFSKRPTKHPITQKSTQKHTPRATEEGEEARGAQVREKKKNSF